MMRETFFVFGRPEHVILNEKDGKKILESQLVIGKGYGDVFATIYLQPRLNEDVFKIDESPVIYLKKKEVEHSVKSIFSVILKIPREQLDLVIDKLSSFFVVDRHGIILETALWFARLKKGNGKQIQKKPFLFITQPYRIFDAGEDWSVFGTSILFLSNVY